MTEFFKLILIKLLVVHFCCDFLFQADDFCATKNNLNTKGLLFQIIHALSHAILSYVFVAQWSLWQLPLIIFASHFVIDVIKATISCKNSFVVFIIDQVLHIATIVLLCLMFSQYFSPEINVKSLNYWTYALGYILLLKPTSVFISLFFTFRKWDNEHNNESLPKAGSWIGYFERILIMTFVILGSYEAIGFLMAAKSIFRFGDLKDKNEIKMTEYVLLGTMISFTTAVVVALVTKELLKNI